MTGTSTGRDRQTGNGAPPTASPRSKNGRENHPGVGLLKANAEYEAPAWCRYQQTRIAGSELLKLGGTAWRTLAPKGDGSFLFLNTIDEFACKD